ncbi:MAG TPA: bifunctional diguanylate cyclase/phosphodiesterase [Acidimicrobiales bacterium]|nr:bifunctional diguanylate cyclase/phosphodiesterase [Acidimicrobiales bacterium]
MVIRGTGLVVTLLLLGVLMMRGERRRDAMRQSRLFLLLALCSVLAAAVMSVAYRVVVGHAPPFPWIADGVALCHVPLAVAGLLRVPAGPSGPGNRLRSLADGALAGSALWYFLLTVHFGHGTLLGGWSGAVRLGYPVGEVFIASVGLAVVARCPYPVRRVVLWLVAGLAITGVGALWGVATKSSVHDWGPWFFLEAGLLVLIGAAVQSAVHDVDEPEMGNTAPAHALWSMVPFLPLLACMVMTSRMIVAGSDMPHAELVPALLVAMSLAVRQFAISTDRQRLVMGLMSRERTLESALRRDHLTGLANRLGMTERMEVALQDPSAWPVCVALLDLNDFKLINDNHGHQIGDAVLRELSQRLAGAVRQEDLVVRLGGDEFAVVATRMTEAQTDNLAERLLRCFDLPVIVNGRTFNVGASIGVVVGRPPETATELLADADAAMYQAKDTVSGASRLRVLGSDDRAKVSRHLRIQEGIALPDLDQFRVVYQPIVELRTGRLRGIEALARWSHPELGTINPDTFIPLAEQAGTIGIIGDRVLATAIEDLGRIKREFPLHRLAVGVNVSPRQLADPEFVDRALSLITGNGLHPDQLVLEITEQAFETNLDPVVETVERLADSGVSIAVDDFGTGYSSLRYLERLRLEIMKIDRAFVSNLTSSRSSHDLVVAVAAMGSALGLQIVAEGIETWEHLRMLQSTSCELGQGYLFSKPVSVSDIRVLVAEGQVYKVHEEYEPTDTADGTGMVSLTAGGGDGPAAA